jgi:hypothetical protein
MKYIVSNVFLSTSLEMEQIPMYSKPKLSTIVTVPPPTELRRNLKVALQKYGKKTIHEPPP